SSQNEFAPVKSQWKNPNDILSILMIIGGDLVQRAVAQLAGAGPFFLTPVAFSFGWVSYSLNALLSSVGDGRLMPPADTPSIIVNAKNGYIRTNQSWVLGRLLRDHRTRHDKEVRGMTVTIYQTSSSKTMGVPDYDWIYWIGWLTILIQHAIAVIPGVIHNNWVVLLITASGTLLALAGGALPQWKAEKWAARSVHSPSSPPKVKREVACLTRGNGSRHVIVIVSEGAGLRLEDLAAARDARSVYSIPITGVLFVLWVAHLLTVAGVQDDAWYLFVVGGLGMLQNVVAAGAAREASALGIHLEGEHIIYGEKVFAALKEAEMHEPGVGICLIPVFFPGALREDEIAWRDARIADNRKREENRKPKGKEGK
ncbi:hypothetical protein OF83DRAFT_1029326, partial [Amylostereum chailletii]